MCFGWADFFRFFLRFFSFVFLRTHTAYCKHEQYFASCTSLLVRNLQHLGVHCVFSTYYTKKAYPGRTRLANDGRFCCPKKQGAQRDASSQKAHIGVVQQLCTRYISNPHGTANILQLYCEQFCCTEGSNKPSGIGILASGSRLTRAVQPEPNIQNNGTPTPTARIAYDRESDVRANRLVIDGFLSLIDTASVLKRFCQHQNGTQHCTALPFYPYRTALHYIVPVQPRCVPSSLSKRRCMTASSRCLEHIPPARRAPTVRSATGFRGSKGQKSEGSDEVK